MPVISVKSVPGCLVTIAPSLIGAPVAFWPFPAPHFEVGPVLAVDPPEDEPPQAATTKSTTAASALRVTRGRFLAERRRMFRSSDGRARPSPRRAAWSTKGGDPSWESSSCQACTCPPATGTRDPVGEPARRYWVFRPCAFSI